MPETSTYNTVNKQLKLNKSRKTTISVYNKKFKHYNYKSAKDI